MGTVILHPHDCLGARFRGESLTTTTDSQFRSNPNPNPSRTSFQSRRRKRSPPSSPRDDDCNRSKDVAMVEKSPAINLVNGQVTILKRGDSLSLIAGKNDRIHGAVVSDEKRKPKVVSVGKRKPRVVKVVEEADLGLGSTNRLGPDPEMMMKQVRVSNHKLMDPFYAGSCAASTSPPPSSLPLPGFIGNKEVATGDLRRLLDLDFDII
ncbi:uncharacterized protein LOC115694729 [Cannabis sativa]|uniref:Uncharacterized protein n=1 Tax=Cannabis sativa TaxID=3483 RepID=A0A803R816_CANSA|nr:uncharacterized protein LOC115694729 [Cannabis sativa]